MDDLISRKAAIDEINNICPVDTEYDCTLLDRVDVRCVLSDLPAAESEWNNHTVACLLADVFGDKCACNFNGIDEWLPEKCEVIGTCPDPGGVVCWEQYLKYRAERRIDE